MKVFLMPFLFLFLSCQPLPKDVPLEKYRRQYIQGQVFLKEELKGKVPGLQSFLVLSVRSPEDSALIAVLKVKNPEFPYSFRISGKHKLNHEKLMEGEVFLTAHLSSSDSLEPKKGDLIGSTTVKVGTKGVKILIDREVE